MSTCTIALIGERDSHVTAHWGIEASVALHVRESNSPLAYRWIATTDVTQESVEHLLRDFCAVWCVPNSPYANTEGALLAIRHARLQQKPFLGTCGGFQHALLEFAQDVLLQDVAHEEIDPEAQQLLISQLSCSLRETVGQVIAEPEFSKTLGARESMEEFNCSYGFNSDFRAMFQNTNLRFVAHDAFQQVRAFSLEGHPFFVGTLFQPERRALSGTLHPVVSAFFAAALLSADK